MFPRSIRVLLIGLSALVSIITALQGKAIWFLYLVIALIFLFEHFRSGPILLALRAYSKEDYEKVQKYINSIGKPEWLRPSTKAYYHYLKGFTLARDQDYKGAKEALLLAIHGKMRSDNLKSATYYFLADTAFHLDELEEARVFLGQAQKTPHREKIDPLLDDLKKKLSLNA